MGRRLIFDLGMHRGEDTEFYLNRGHDVVGVEANPQLAQLLQAKFSSEISSGQLHLVDKAIADQPGKARFAINSVNSVWGTMSQAFIDRNQQLGATSEFIEVDTVSLDDLIRAYGTPYYLKADIEGMDLTCVKALHRVAVRPRYVSVESAVTSSVAEIETAFDELAHLWVLGYRHFKYVDQARLRRLNGTLLDVEGLPLRYVYRQDSSGPFGEESPGKWRSIGSALIRMRALIFYQNTIGLGGRHHRALGSRVGRRLYRYVNQSHSWYDLHARMG